MMIISTRISIPFRKPHARIFDRGGNQLIPTFETDFLAEIGASIRRRQKAIKNKAFGLSCERLWETSDKEKREKLELTLVGPRSSRSAQLRFFAWSDRWIFA